MYPKVVLFDLDGTLLDNSPQVVEAYHRGASALGYTISRELISQQAGKSTFETSRAMGIPEEHHAEMDAYFWQYFGELTADPSTDFTILDGVPELLSALKSQSIIMGVVTSNRADYARTMLERTNLLHYFNVVVGKETVADLRRVLSGRSVFHNPRLYSQYSRVFLISFSSPRLNFRIISVCCTPNLLAVPLP